MGEKKVTIMILKVDLQCSKCYKKVKKVLCKFPQIQDQLFDEKTNTVRIKVVCCNPERIRDKLCCKGDGSIKSIEILEPEKPKPKPKPAPDPAPAQEKKTDQPKPKPQPPAPAPAPVIEKPADQPKPKPQPSPPPPPDQPKPKPIPEPSPALPPPTSVPVGMCCTECYQGQGGGPCYQLGYGQERYYEGGYYGRPVYDSWGGGCDNRAYTYRSRCSDYISEENPAAPCTIM